MGGGGRGGGGGVNLNEGVLKKNFFNLNIQHQPTYSLFSSYNKGGSQQGWLGGKAGQVLARPLFQPFFIYMANSTSHAF